MPGVIAHVDDDQDIRDAVRRTLRDEGYQVATFEQAQHLLDAIRCGSLVPDLVILDVMVEKEDAGLTAYDQLSQEHPHIPVVVLSSLGELIRPYFELHMEKVQIVEKPVIPYKLLAVVGARLKRPLRSRRVEGTGG